MEITIQNRDIFTIMGLSGKLDNATTQVAYDKMLPQVTADCRLVFDMEDCSYVSSAGLRVILMLGKAIKKQNGKGVMANLSEDVKDVMEMTGFDHIFSNYDTLDDALAALK